MGALGSLRRKMVKSLKPAGFFSQLSPAQRRQALLLDQDYACFPMEVSEAEIAQRETVGVIQPSHPQRYESHGHEWKGRVFNGECNRSACNNRRAVYYNISTYSYYCGSCAHAINGAAGRGKRICERVENNLTHDQMNTKAKDYFQ